MGQPRWMLVATEGQFSGKSFSIPENGITFGREADNTLILDDEKISRRHAVLRMVDGQPLIEDLKSRNGTFVNNNKVSRQPLAEGDRIALGSSLFFVRPEAAEAQPLPKPEPEATIVSVRPRSPLARTQAIVVGDANAAPTPNLAAPAVGVSPRVTASGGGAVELAAPVPTPDVRVSAAPELPIEPERPADPSIFEEATGVLPNRAALEQAMAARNNLNAGNLAGAMTELGAPIFGGAAAVVPVEPLSTSPMNAALPPLPMPAPLEPLGRTPARGGRMGVFIAGGVLAVMVVGVAAISLRGTGGAAPEKVAAPIALPPPSAGEMASVLSGNAAPAKPTLSAEEQALSADEKRSRAQEAREQGDSLMASGRFKEARDEFARALALDPDCQVCLLRLTRVQMDIKANLERYRTDAVRAHQAMDYPTAQRNWQMVLELETDPDARKAAMDGLRQAKQQLQQQPYR